MIVIQANELSPVLLTETAADNELQLQEQMKNNPDLLPVDEFGMSGPLMVVGRETQLSSGAVDLLAIARSGELLIVEFKTGPQNADFRRVLAQLLDYGSNLWQLSYEEFQQSVARRYFESDYCQHPEIRGLASLDQAARALWKDLTEEEMALFQERLAEQLRTGAFHYLVVAQRFMPTTERTIEYLNAVIPAARFYAVELVRFTSATLSAFEARTVLKPALVRPGTSEVATSETRFLDELSDDDYREALHRLLEHCKRLGLRFEWGTKGASIRVQTPERAEPLSIAWLFPPGVVGWMGLMDLSLGYDPTSLRKVPTMATTFDDYLKDVAALPEVAPVKPSWLQARHLKPGAVIQSLDEIVDILTELVGKISG